MIANAPRLPTHPHVKPLPQVARRQSKGGRGERRRPRCEGERGRADPPEKGHLVAAGDAAVVEVGSVAMEDLDPENLVVLRRRLAPDRFDYRGVHAVCDLMGCSDRYVVEARLL